MLDDDYKTIVIIYKDSMEDVRISYDYRSFDLKNMRILYPDVLQKDYLKMSKELINKFLSNSIIRYQNNLRLSNDYNFRYEYFMSEDNKMIILAIGDELNKEYNELFKKFSKDYITKFLNILNENHNINLHNINIEISDSYSDLITNGNQLKVLLSNNPIVLNNMFSVLSKLFRINIYKTSENCYNILLNDVIVCNNLTTKDFEIIQKYVSSKEKEEYFNLSKKIYN